ncbi:uncharacterized protein V6R79_008897 [Siganus canaliculatus]
MEEEAPSRRSVAELAGRFKGSSAPPDAAGNEQKTEKPVRRRPPRSLQLSKPHGDEQEQSPDVTSPVLAKAKRNSALIEKLQASLVLSPSALMASPLSPGFRMLPPAFPSPSSGSAPVSTTASTACVGTPTSPVLTSPPTEEEGPASFETPPSVGEGSILSNDSVKGRARHSIRRRPPSRRHRKSSSDDVAVGNEGQETSMSSPSEAEAKPPRENGQTEEEEKEEKEVKEGEKEVKEEEKKVKEEKKEVKEAEKEEEEEVKGEKEEDKTDASACPEQTEAETRDQDEKKEEEPPEKSPEKQEDDVTQEVTNTNEEEKTEETTSPDSVR